MILTEGQCNPSVFSEAFIVTGMPALEARLRSTEHENTYTNNMRYSCYRL